MLSDWMLQLPQCLLNLQIKRAGKRKKEQNTKLVLFWQPSKASCKINQSAGDSYCFFFFTEIYHGANILFILLWLPIYKRLITFDFQISLPSRQESNLSVLPAGSLGDMNYSSQCCNYELKLGVCLLLDSAFSWHIQLLLNFFPRLQSSEVFSSSAMKGSLVQVQTYTAFHCWPHSCWEV